MKLGWENGGIIFHQKVAVDNVKIRHTQGSEGWPRESFVGEEKY